jgi:gamma-glutamyltranspeptidase
MDPRPQVVSVDPTKRPLNNVCPTIIRLPDCDVALGLRGRRRFVNVAAHLCRQIVEHSATGLEVITAPRLHIEEQDPIEVTRNLHPDLVSELQSLGQEIPHRQRRRRHRQRLRTAARQNPPRRQQPPRGWRQ